MKGNIGQAVQQKSFSIRKLLKEVSNVVQEMANKEVYYYMTSEDVGVNECEEGFGGTEYSEEITDWQKSKYYDTFDECFLDWVKCSPEEKTPIMKGMIEK